MITWITPICSLCSFNYNCKNGQNVRMDLHNQLILMRTWVIHVYHLKTWSFYVTLDICHHGTAWDIKLQCELSWKNILWDLCWLNQTSCQLQVVYFTKQQNTIDLIRQYIVKGNHPWEMYYVPYFQNFSISRSTKVLQIWKYRKLKMVQILYSTIVYSSSQQWMYVCMYASICYLLDLSHRFI